MSLIGIIEGRRAIEELWQSLELGCIARGQYPIGHSQDLAEQESRFSRYCHILFNESDQILPSA
jgi:hypothetical protein